MDMIKKNDMKKCKFNKKGIGMVLCMLLAGVTAGCGFWRKSSDAHGKNGYEHISQEEAKRIMDEEENIIILDVRTQEEYDSGHIKGAVCIPNETISEDVIEKLPDKDQKILVYCRSGNRSRQAAGKLYRLGYTNVREFGGIITWQYGIEM